MVRGWLKIVLIFVLIPILVGVVIQVATSLYNQYQSRRQILAVVEGPFPLDELRDLFSSLKIEVGNKDESQKVSPSKVTAPPKGAPTGTFGPLSLSLEFPVSDLHIYRVTIRNTGSSPIRDLPVRLVFEKVTKNFYLLAYKHKTTPAREFGKINDDYTDSVSPVGFTSC